MDEGEVLNQKSRIATYTSRKSIRGVANRFLFVLFLLVSFWFPFGFLLVSFWFPFGFLLVSFWFPFGFPKQFDSCERFVGLVKKGLRLQAAGWRFHMHTEKGRPG